MNRSAIAAAPDDSAALAARLLYRYNVGALPVCLDDGRLQGIITDRDIVLRCVAAEIDPEKTPVRDIMTRSLVTASPHDDVRRAAQLMASAQVRRLPVAEGGRLVGMLSLGDLALARSCDAVAAHALTDISANLRRC
jgi:CBS domain-containing protein